MLGVIIGVSSVVIIGAVGKVGKMLVFKELQTFGLKSLWVYRTWEEKPGKIQRSGTGITNDDIQAIRKECRLVKLVSPCLGRWGVWAKYKTKYTKVNVQGVDVNYDKIGNEYIKIGRFLTTTDIEQRRNVCIIGSDVYKELFDNKEKPIGKEIYIQNRRYTVVGVLKRKDRDFIEKFGPKGSIPNANERIIIPYTIIQHQENTKDVHYIQASAYSKDMAKKAAVEIKNLLTRRHKGQFKYTSETMQEHIEFANTVINILRWIALTAASVSLIVGGIGIMNIMTTTVVERTKEIGIRKAIGARDIDILMQFLVEAVVISLCGGIIGIALGVITTFTIEYISGYPLIVSYGYIILAFFVSIVVGITSGIYPAVRAAKLDPVEALRYE
jgi:ABC-type antimicrobial peptide transport system permease subunit